MLFRISRPIRLARFTLITTLVLGGALPALAQDAPAEDGSAAEVATGLSIRSITLAKGVERGRAIEETDTFRRGRDRIFAIVRLNNPEREETQVFVSFEAASDDTRRGIELDVPARRRYRTTARTGSRRAAGSYRVVVRDAAGNVLGSMPYELVE